MKKTSCLKYNQVTRVLPTKNVNYISLREKLDVYKRKKHSDLLCFLVAGRRIELRTS